MHQQYQTDPSINPTKILTSDSVTYVLHDAIDQTDRARYDFGKLEELAKSIATFGLIHPPLVTVETESKRLTLVGGGRRIAAMRMLGLIAIPVHFREDLPAHLIAEMEAEENAQRLNMKWQEQALLITRTHQLKKRAAIIEGENWGLAQCGELFGVTAAHVSHCNTIVDYIIGKDAEILAAPSIKAAYDIILARKEKLAMQLSATMQRPLPAVTPAPDFPAMDLASILGDNSGPSMTSIMQDGLQPNTDLSALIGTESPTAGTILDMTEIPLSKMFFRGDCIEVMSRFPEHSVDHVVTDIPYGIPMENLDKIKGLDEMVDTHDVDENVSLMQPFLEAAFRVIKPNGFCVFFYDLDHHEKLQQWAIKAGFSVQRWPLIWHKLHPCLNNAATKNYTKNYEVAMVCRKGLGTLLSAQASSIVAADNSVERRMFENPFTKPAKVWHFIYDAIAYKGQTVLDSFNGESSSSLAAIDAGLTPMGIELDENRFNRGLVNVRNKFDSITNKRATYI
jgi:site-specific DNA-methyltransferase (adenine-specific)